MGRARTLTRRAVPLLGGALLVAAAASGCAVPLTRTCPRCPQLVLGERPSVPPGTRTLFVLVPGLLGYGWEWNGAQIALGQLEAASVLVYEWDPWASLYVASRRLAEHCRFLLRRLPPSVRKVVVIGHSAAGLLAVRAAGELTPPAGVQLEVLAVGAPLAGMGINPWSPVDLTKTVLPIALSGSFVRWPEPAQGLRLRIFPTGPTDPVMRPRFGHDPADARVLPPGAELTPLPRELDHNVALSYLARRIVAEERAARAPASAEAATTAPATEAPTASAAGRGAGAQN